MTPIIPDAAKPVDGLRSRGALWNERQLEVPFLTTREMLFESSYWVHLAAQISEGDTIIVRHIAGLFQLELLVRSTGKNHNAISVVALNEFVEDEPTGPTEWGGLKVDWRPAEKWGLVLDTGEFARSGFFSRLDACAALEAIAASPKASKSSPKAA